MEKRALKTFSHIYTSGHIRTAAKGMYVLFTVQTSTFPSGFTSHIDFDYAVS